MGSCLFCEFAIGKQECFKVWEDSNFIAFLTPFGNTKGFTVVIPKEHYSSYIFNVPEKIMSDLMIASKKVANLLEERLKVKRCAVVFEGYGVDHLHAKLIPLHGIQHEEWKPISNDKSVSKYFHEYEGYISSHDGERIPDIELKKIISEINN